MVGSGIIYILILVTFSTLRSTQDGCSHFEMRKQVPDKDAFARKLRKTYKSVNSSGLQCAPRCYDDERCNGMFVCPDVCHLLGVFDTVQTSSSATDYDNCDLYIMNRCENGGEPDESGYCRCGPGYGGPTCLTIVQDSCYGHWQPIHDTTNGQSLDALLQASKNSCGIRLKYVSSDNKTHTMDSLGVTSGKTWAQSVHHLSKSSWNTFETIPRRTFESTANALYQTVVSFDVSGTYIGSSTAEIAAKWYVKNFTELVPYFENDANGAVVFGDLHSLAAKIKAGSALTSYPTVFVTADSKVISVSAISHVGQTFSATYVSLGAQPYWFLFRSTSAGQIYVLRWNVGEGTQRSKKKSSMSKKWCTDDCWLKILTSDQSGKEDHGSATHLAQALLSGHRLRVYVVGVAADTRAVYIHGSIISASLEDMMEPIGISDFDPSGFATRVLVSSSGRVVFRTYTFETDTIKGNSQGQVTVDWFVDTREWTRVLSLSRDGSILIGSVTDLRQKVLGGASVRIVVELLTGGFLIVDANHLEVSSAGHVAADVTYHVNTEFGENNAIHFTAGSAHHLWSAIITTEGTFNKYLYTYKKNTGQHTPVVDVDRYTWFVQM